jgi:hypothetical protein
LGKLLQTKNAPPTHLHLIPNYNTNKQTKNKSTPYIIENKICSTILIATNFVQEIELFKLHKIQEMSFGDSKYKTHLQQTKIQA